MPAVQSRLDAHRRNAAKAAKILQKAREDAFKSRGYQSAPTRAKFRTEFSARNDGMVAHDWQIDFAEALHLGLDCSLIAGTGAGKTMPFVMPLFVDSGKMMMIISPLNALEEDQASRFRKMGLSAVAVNGDTYSDAVHKEIQKFKHRVIITSPDMCLKHDKFRQLLSTPAFAKKIAAFVIDEAHCISQWGDSFQAEYAELGTLRAFVPSHVPFMVASATLQPLVLAEVRKSVHISPDNSYHVNLGTDRPNIAWFMHHMKAAKVDLDALDFVIPPHDSEDAWIELLQTMVFFDDICLAMNALEHLRNHLPRRLRGAIAVYHSCRSKCSKRIIMEKFRKGEIKILLTTEAAGMGCDIPHVEQVVQFLVPGSLAIWMQCAGRAGRNFLVFASAILLVQPSVFKELSAKKGTPPTDEVVFQKAVEEGLREWIETKDCRREVADEYFDNAPTGICCDNCLQKTSPEHSQLILRSTIVEPASADLHAPPSQYRRDQHLNGARALLTNWRAHACATLYRRRPWGRGALLSDEVLTRFATRAHLKTVDDLVSAGFSPTHAKRHGQELLSMLGEYDAEYKRERAAANKRKMDAQKAETAKRRRLEKEQKALERSLRKEAKATLPKKQRKSRAKPKLTPVLQQSTSTNLLYPFVTPSRLEPHSFATPQPTTAVPALHLPFDNLEDFPLALANASRSEHASTFDHDVYMTPLDGLPMDRYEPYNGRFMPQLPIWDEPDSYPQPLFFHDQSGVPLNPPLHRSTTPNFIAHLPAFQIPNTLPNHYSLISSSGINSSGNLSGARLNPTSFYGMRLPQPFLPDHHSSLHNSSSTPQFQQGSSSSHIPPYVPNNDDFWA